MDPTLVIPALLAFPVLILLGRALFVPRITADDLLQRTDLAWPRGVQEEEPAPWHLDRLARRPASRRPSVPD